MQKRILIEAQQPFWKDYELIDSGAGYKLERFGEYVLARPEPQAVWDPALQDSVWRQYAHARFDLAAKGQSDERGAWQISPHVRQPWYITYESTRLSLRFRLAMTSFKHIGLFPEQAVNWEYIAACCRRLSRPRVLNLFAYTGGASLAARACGAEVVHVDAVKQVIGWANQNQEASALQDIRWVVEDAMKFVRREVRRGHRYQGIILDPPAYGRGPKGEKWVLEEHINMLLQHCVALLDEQKHFFLLNLYSMGFSALVADSLVRTVFRGFAAAHVAQLGELYVCDRAARRLPLGTFLRFDNILNKPE